MTESVQPTIVVLKTGEKLITYLQEAFEGEGEDRKGICLVMSYPYELSLMNVEPTGGDEMDLQVKYSKWCPYSLDSQYRIPYDAVMTIGTPDPGLANAYKVKVETQRSLEQPDPSEGGEEGGSVAQQQADIAAAIGSAGVPDGVGVGGSTEPPVPPSPVEVV